MLYTPTPKPPPPIKPDPRLIEWIERGEPMPWHECRWWQKALIILSLGVYYPQQEKENHEEQRGT